MSFREYPVQDRKCYLGTTLQLTVLIKYYESYHKLY